MEISGKAPESYQIQKARKKLIKQMEQENKRINKKALNQMKQAIQIWISRHEPERVALQDRPIQLFDENTHPAKTKSKFVTDLLQSLEEKGPKAPSLKTLSGRIKK
jgi:hypothetical protein